MSLYFDCERLCSVDPWNDSFWLVSVSLEIATFGTCYIYIYGNRLDYCFPHIHGSMQNISLADAYFHNFHKLCVSQHQLLHDCWRLTLILMMSVMQ